MSERDFTPIADSACAREVIDFYARARRGARVERRRAVNTLETNSGFVERRGSAAAARSLYRATWGCDSLEGLRVLDLGCGFGALSAFFAGTGRGL